MNLANIPIIFSSAKKNLSALHLPGMKMAPNPRDKSVLLVRSAFGGNALLARIEQDGTVALTAQGNKPAVIGVLEELDRDGTDYIARVGKLTGRCVYCGMVLKDPASITLGYGPVCARYHALPHGKGAASLVLDNDQPAVV